jgi:hypothetical protein
MEMQAPAKGNSKKYFCRQVDVKMPASVRVAFIVYVSDIASRYEHVRVARRARVAAALQITFHSGPNET